MFCQQLLKLCILLKEKRLDEEFLLYGKLTKWLKSQVLLNSKCEYLGTNLPLLLQLFLALDVKPLLLFSFDVLHKSFVCF